MYRVVIVFGALDVFSESLNSFQAATEFVDRWGQFEVPGGPHVHSIERYNEHNKIWEMV